LKQEVICQEAQDEVETETALPVSEADGPESIEAEMPQLELLE
jgi:hypothetical protein